MIVRFVCRSRIFDANSNVSHSGFCDVWITLVDESIVFIALLFQHLFLGEKPGGQIWRQIDKIHIKKLDKLLIDETMEFSCIAHVLVQNRAQTPVLNSPKTSNESARLVFSRAAHDADGMKSRIEDNFECLLEEILAHVLPPHSGLCPDVGLLFQSQMNHLDSLITKKLSNASFGHFSGEQEHRVQRQRPQKLEILRIGNRTSIDPALHQSERIGRHQC